MASEHPTEAALTLNVEGGARVSARLVGASGARACYVLAHGAGAGMEHPFMQAAAAELAALGIATLRFQFPYMERRSRRPDRPPLCHASVRAAVAKAAELLPAMPLFAGGRSFGGRMSSQAQALDPLPGVRGLVFLGFPLHLAGQPAMTRAQHLSEVSIPMLFVQGTRDALAERTRLETLMKRLEGRARLHWVEGADHSFHVPASSGRTDSQVRGELLRAVAAWMESLL
ncbi:MAG TPA: alpha/beta family hydrolase [Steroidobacteraceae bacterium]|nr:alpha/beta family hydrolase [Steroidobacteraceae bacterium]